MAASASTDRAGEPISARRREILDAAARLFARQGYTGASMRDIGRAVGLRGPSIYSHFDSKDEMLLDLLVPPLEEIYSALTRPAHDSATGGERLEALVGAAVDTCLDHRDAFIILFQERHLIEEQPALAEIAVLSGRLWPLWLEVVEQGVDDGSVDASVPPRLIIQAIYSLLFGALSDRHVGLHTAAEPDLVDRDHLRTMVMTVLFRGISPLARSRGVARE